MRETTIDTVDVRTAGLADGVRAREPDAWRELYAELGEAVYRLLHRKTGDEHLARDLTHDTFVIVARKGHQYSGRGSLRGWVFSIATNLVRERIRREQTHRRKAEEVLDWRSHRASVPDIELRLALDLALAELSEGQRTVLLLYDVDGYTHPEIAEMLDIAEGTSKARLSRARARLREILRNVL